MCIFSCLTIHAVYIEVALDLSTDAFINVLRRFIAQRGCPLNVLSDNGTNFVGAKRILKEALKAWNNNQIEDHLKQRVITWTFNPPAASHMGGSWERQIRFIRRILSSVLHSLLVFDDELSTVSGERRHLEYSTFGAYSLWFRRQWAFNSQSLTSSTRKSQTSSWPIWETR